MKAFPRSRVACKVAALGAVALLSVACGGDSEDPWTLDGEPAGIGTSDAAPVGVTTLPSGPPQAPITAGGIKSFFEDLELEPPILTGSIFANGFTLEEPVGMGGAGVSSELTDPVNQLGLGHGDLTTLVLFDRSVSMSDLWEGEPRWEVVSRAFMDGLRGYEESVTIGAIFFPQAAECEVAPLSDPRQIQLQTGTRFRQHWEAFPQNRFPSGGTPLGAAFEEADAAIDEAEKYGLLAPGRRFRVAVVTDGKPNCGTDLDRVLFLAREWADRGIEINVIGLPGSEDAAQFLAELAAIGGTSFAAVTDEAGAEEVLQVIVK